MPRPERDGKGKRASRKLAEVRELRRAARRVVHREKGPRKDDKPSLPDRPKEKRSVLRTFTLVTQTDPGTLMARVKREANERGAEFRGGRGIGKFFRERGQRRVQDGGQGRDHRHNRETLVRPLGPSGVRAEEAFGLRASAGSCDDGSEEAWTENSYGGED